MGVFQILVLGMFEILVMGTFQSMVMVWFRLWSCCVSDRGHPE